MRTWLRDWLSHRHLRQADRIFRRYDHPYCTAQQLFFSVPNRKLIKAKWLYEKYLSAQTKPTLDTWENWCRGHAILFIDRINQTLKGEWLIKEKQQ